MKMAGKQIQFYYKNVLADVIGPENGITAQQLDELARQTTPVSPKIKDEILTGNSRYGLLPGDPQIAKSVKALVKQFKPKCENLVVLGIGGSALGNIALQKDNVWFFRKYFVNKFCKKDTTCNVL